MAPIDDRHYYNEIDNYVADWLENLIAAKLLPAGDVDRRSIVDVEPTDLHGYVQCHFFAGIGGWPLALKLAGWPTSRGVWTGSCPCQPFSQIGKRAGASDERHLWPFLHRLIRYGRPPVVFGEQVTSADGRLWYAGVRADLEALGYAVGAADLYAASVSAPHIRHRIYWVGDADHTRLEGHARHGDEGRRQDAVGSTAQASGAVPWNAFVRIIDRHGSARRAEPGVSPMARRVPQHMGLLRAYGNAIVPQLGAEFVKAWMECRPAEKTHARPSLTLERKQP